jgi:hypothetical protein
MTETADSADKLTHDDKLNLLDSLSMVLSRTTYLKIWCEQHNDANAGALEQRRISLSASYDKLSAALWDDWIGAAKAVNASMNSATDAVLESVDKVKADVAAVQNVVKALGFIDQIIQIAGTLRP